MNGYTLVGRTDPGPDQRLHVRAVYGDRHPSGGIPNPTLCGEKSPLFVDVDLDIAERVAGRRGVCKDCSTLWTACECHCRLKPEFVLIPGCVVHDAMGGAA